jgi:hypothetical protein
MLTPAVQRIRDWLQEHPTLVAVIGPAGAALCGVGIRFTQQTKWLAMWFVLLATFSAIPSIAARVNRLQQGRRAANRCIKQVLEACASAMGYPAVHIRVNIMRFSSDRQRRTVDQQTAFNMDGDPDNDLDLDARGGASGQVVINRRPTIGDLALPLQRGGPDWGMSEAEKARVRQTLQSILSVPVFKPGDPSGDLLATLQIDSDLALEASGLGSDQKREVAQRFADVVSLLLEAGG